MFGRSASWLSSLPWSERAAVRRQSIPSRAPTTPSDRFRGRRFRAPCVLGKSLRGRRRNQGQFALLHELRKRFSEVSTWGRTERPCFPPATLTDFVKPSFCDESSMLLERLGRGTHLLECRGIWHARCCFSADQKTKGLK